MCVVRTVFERTRQRPHVTRVAVRVRVVVVYTYVDGSCACVRASGGHCKTAVAVVRVQLCGLPRHVRLAVSRRPSACALRPPRITCKYAPARTLTRHVYNNVRRAAPPPAHGACCSNTLCVCVCFVA